MIDPWLDPLLTECSCRHCRAGRMCRGMADRFRAYVRVRADASAGIDVHSIDMEEQRGETLGWWERGWVQVLIIAVFSVSLIGLIVMGAVR